MTKIKAVLKKKENLHIDKSYVKKGYKKTKVGVIPLEWEVVKIGEVITLLTDYHANGAYEKLKENVELLSYEDYAIMIRTTNFEKNNFTDNLIYVREKAYNYLKKSKVYENDIIINKIANAGATYFMPKIDKPVSLAMNLFLLRLNNEVNKKFIYIQIKQREKYLKALSSGTTTKTITKNDVRGFQIPLPPLKEQQKIAKILTTWDDAISKQEELIKVKGQLKKGLMQKLLSGEVRFDGFSGEWEEVRLGNFLIERNIKAPKNNEYPLMAFIANIGVAHKGERYNREFLVNDSNSKKYKQTEYGDFIYSSNNLETGSIGLNLYGSASISPVYSIFKIQEPNNYQFMGSFLVQKRLLRKMIRYRQGVVYGQWRIHEYDFLNIKEKIPSVKEQQKIAQVLSTADKEIELLKNELESLKEQKKGLMQKLLTGEVRVKV